MTFTVPTRTAVRDALLRDLLSQLPTADVSVDSDWYVRATAHAAAAEGLYAHQLWIARQILPDVCDEDVLERHAAARGITRKLAGTATGVVYVTAGTAGVVVPAALVCRRADGTTYATTASVTLGAAGSAEVPLQAVEAGASGNADAGAVLTWSGPPAGLPATATGGALTGGADAEATDALRERLAWRMRNPPAGGHAADYITWATSVAGVDRAWSFPLRRGDGTVDVAVMAAGGLPSAALVAAVQSYIDARRPVMKTGGCRVVAPTAVAVPVTASWTLDGTVDQATALATATAALQSYFDGLEPGATVVRNRIVAIIADTPGVSDFVLSAPAINVVTTVSAGAVQLAMLGAVDLS